MSRYDDDRDCDDLRFFIRRIDQRWHVTATGGGQEHTHEQGFHDQGKAYDFRDQVRDACERGRDLNLAHWETVDLD
jgi:hypothetical protein